ncbi:MAG: putative rane protein [Candidatus Eremiobacteraeota bacterium]|jgi:putative membrane protein|nr:putative rane protein [Candidatus Eremiobacteraeota bacterium]
MKTMVIFAALVAAVAVPALAQTIPSPQTSASEGEKATATLFVQDSVGDVQLGMLGLQKARNASVRALAHAMVRDHTRTAQAGMQVAQQIGDDEAQFKAGDDNQIHLSHLARYAGATFDREFIAAMIDAHKNDIATARDALEFAVTPALRTYLRDAIAVDTRHLHMAEAAQTQVGKPG